MLMPSTNTFNRIFGENLLDDFFNLSGDFFGKGSSVNGLMQTDVEETDKGYEVTMNLPGFSKEDVKGELKDGYLVISASTSHDNDEKDKEGRFIRRERYSGSCTRSFYVGEDVRQEDIKARFENGILKLTVPKKEPAGTVEEKRYIAIEG